MNPPRSGAPIGLNGSLAGNTRSEWMDEGRGKTSERPMKMVFWSWTFPAPVPGQHLVEVMVRAAGKLSTQRVTKEFPVISHAANRFAGHVRDGLVAVHTWGKDGQSTDTLVDVL